MASIQFRGTRQDVRNVVYRLRAMLSGRAPDEHGVARGVLLSIGFAALSDIKDAYVIKANGGADAMGVSWPDLNPKTKAYGRRFGSGEHPALKRQTGLGRGNRLAPGDKRGLLTAAQLKRWRQIFAQVLAKLRLSLDEADAKQRAAQIAWTTLKREGAQTKLNVFGSRKVQILRDSGVLLNSLSPGTLSGSAPTVGYSKPTSLGGQDQVFDLRSGEVIVGTNVPYASAHQQGVPGKLPRRQFLPDNADQVPEIWWQNWLDAGNRALLAGAEILFRGAA